MTPPAPDLSSSISILGRIVRRVAREAQWPPVQTLVNSALHALDEAEGWLTRASAGDREPIMKIVDLEVAAAETRLRIVIDLLELYGTSMGWKE